MSPASALIGKLRCHFHDLIVPQTGVSPASSFPATLFRLRSIIATNRLLIEAPAAVALQMKLLATLLCWGGSAVHPWSAPQ